MQPDQYKPLGTMVTQAKTHLLYLAYVWPEPASSAAGYRTMGLLQAFVEAGWEITFMSAAQTGPHSLDLSTLGIHPVQITLNSSDFDHLLQSMHVDIVVYDRFMLEEQYAWRVNRYFPSALKVLDTCDLHFIRRLREKHKLDFAVFEPENTDFFTPDSYRELAAMYRCDLSLIISPAEMQLLQTQFQFPARLLLKLGFMLPPPAQPTAFEHRQHFFMIGNALHKPNLDAIHWFAQKIWPGIQHALPQAECHIYGAYFPQSLQQYHRPEQGLHIMGRAEQLPELMSRYRINLAPLRFGAGLKGKIIDGFQQGLPCVSTAIGAEGMCEQHAFGGLIADNEKDFQAACIRLYQDRTDWQQLQTAAINCLHAHQYLPLKEKLLERIVLQQQQLMEIRSQNFTGSMLNYHLHQSSQYLSRWIELKNDKTTKQP